MIGGWVGFRQMEVVRKNVESATVTSFYLKPAGADKTIMDFLPGQYLSFRIPKDEFQVN